MLALSVSLLLVGVATAESVDPIVCSMEVNPSRLAAPGTVNVTINISNSSAEDMKDPLVLYNPVSQPVADFGTNGSFTLKAGESKTWQGTWDVNQQMLNHGAIGFFVKYTLYRDSGEGYSQSQPIRGTISQQTAFSDIEVKRTITPAAAREDQEVIVQYDISNIGTVPLDGVTIQENNDINKELQKLPPLDPGKTAQVKFPVKMGKQDLTSSAVVTYQGPEDTQPLQKEVEAATIVYGEPSLSAALSADAKGAPLNGKVTLSLSLQNKGTVEYSDLKVTDPTLGEVFSNQKVAKNNSLTLTKEITLTASTTYQFTVEAIDDTGTPISLSSNPVTVEAVDPNSASDLDVELTADRTEVYEQPGHVRFTIAVTNNGSLDAKDVTVAYGSTRIYTFPSIPSGETRKLTRDTALSMEGRYQFSASITDALGTTRTFNSNELQIAFSVPTPAPATPTPPPNPTPEPVFIPDPTPAITDKDIAPIPKLIQTILLPFLILASLALIASIVLVAIAGTRRAKQKKASANAYDHLERAKRRDYASPAEEAENVSSPLPQATAKESTEENDLFEEEDLPHMKYVRDAVQRSPKQPLEHASTSLYDDELYGDDDGFGMNEPSFSEEAYSENYQSGPDDVYEDFPAEDVYDGSYEDSYETPYEETIEEAAPAAEEIPARRQTSRRATKAKRD